LPPGTSTGDLTADAGLRPLPKAVVVSKRGAYTVVNPRHYEMAALDAEGVAARMAQEAADHLRGVPGKGEAVESPQDTARSPQAAA
jgi:hypothetical protein